MSNPSSRTGSDPNGSLRSFSNLESFDSRPLHVTTDSKRKCAFGYIGRLRSARSNDVRDFHLVRRRRNWKVVWAEEFHIPNVPAQVVPGHIICVGIW